MSNPGPSSSSNINTQAVTGAVAAAGKPSFFLAGNTPISPFQMSQAFGSIYGLSSAATPTGIAPSGTMGANGALTLGTSLILTYGGAAGASVGIWLYFPAGAVYGGSVAGSYWCVMSSGTAGTVYNNIYIAPNLNPPPTTLVPVVDPGPGSYTGVTTEVVVFGSTIPAGNMGTTGVLESFHLISANNNANVKTARVRFGGIAGTIFETLTLTNTRTSTSLTHILNRDATNIQVGSPAVGFGNSASGPVIGNIDTTVDQQVVTTLQMATATDFMICEIVDLDIDNT